MNYENLNAWNPTQYGKITNSRGQEIVFVEHPTRGDEFFVIAMCHDLKVAEATEFFELDDMTAEHGEYEPYFDENKILQYGR